jgi:hypothetical protein
MSTARMPRVALPPQIGHEMAADEPAHTRAADDDFL